MSGGRGRTNTWIYSLKCIRLQHTFIDFYILPKRRLILAEFASHTDGTGLERNGENPHRRAPPRASSIILIRCQIKQEIFLSHIVLIEIVRHINDSQMTSQLIGEKEDPEDGYE